MAEITIEEFSSLYKAAAEDAGLTAEFVSDAVVLRLYLIMERLIENGKRLNLTAILEPEGIVMKHFVDSLIPLKLILELGIVPRRAADIGTGAGYPLLPFAAVLADVSPGTELFGIDSTAKKISHIIDTAEYAKLTNIKAISARAEEIASTANGKKGGYRQAFDLVTARAVSSLPVLCELTAPLLKIGGHFAALKTPDDAEIAQGDRAAAQLGLQNIGRTDYKLPNGDSRCLVIYKKTAATPDKYPRRYADITKHPLG